jgi:hypothetical protein
MLVFGFVKWTKGQVLTCKEQQIVLIVFNVLKRKRPRKHKSDCE